MADLIATYDDAVILCGLLDKRLPVKTTHASCYGRVMNRAWSAYIVAFWSVVVDPDTPAPSCAICGKVMVELA